MSLTRKTLLQHQIRPTNARLVILEILDMAKKPLSTDEVYERAKERASLSLATTYRALELLSEHHLALRSRDRFGKFLYQSIHGQHMHQLICTECEKTVNLELCPIERTLNDLENSTDFEITGHSLEIYGVCPSCQKKKGKSSQK